MTVQKRLLSLLGGWEGLYCFPCTYYPVLASKLVSTGMMDSSINCLRQTEHNTGTAFCPNSKFLGLDAEFNTVSRYYFPLPPIIQCHYWVE